MGQLHQLATLYHRAPSSYYDLTGHAAELFDFAIAWGFEHLPEEKPAKEPGLLLRG